MEFIQNELNEIKELLLKLNTQQKEFFTIEEASEYLSISKSALYKKTKAKEIAFYQPGGKKIYFKREDIDNWILKSQVESSDSIGLEVDGYLTRNSKS